jgi:hypothetical protein
MTLDEQGRPGVGCQDALVVTVSNAANSPPLMSNQGMMTNTHRFVALLIGATVALSSSTALLASDPMGLYAVVEKVVLEPSESEPLRVQIWGAFAISDGQKGDGYGAPQTGYVYYSCPSGAERTCRNEWSDLKSVAGTGTGVGFGGRYLSAGRVRKAAEKPEKPDAYPIKMGVMRMGSQHAQPAIVAELKKALTPR